MRPTPNDRLHLITLHLPGGAVRRVSARARDFILDAARDGGLRLPSMCEQGWCTTCTCRVLSGRLDESTSRYLYDEDREAGFALICSVRALSDVELVTHQQPELRAHRAALGLHVPPLMDLDAGRLRP
jgi:ferredoxin